MVSTAAIREHYDSLALIYQTFWGDHIHHGLFETGKESARQAQERMLDYCVALARPQGHVLDVGCGHGGTTLRLAANHECTVVGLTLSSKQARIARAAAARAALSGRIDIRVENAEIFAYPLAAFDLVWTMESSEHFHDKPGYLRNVAHTLRPGGRLLLAAWTGAMQQPEVRAVAEAFLCPELWTAARYAEAMRQAGLHVEHCEDLSARVVRTWEICAERARAAHAVVRLLPAGAREFVAGIDTILRAYRCGALSYTVMLARR